MADSATLLVFPLFIHLICAFFSLELAKAKEMSPGKWFVLGIFFGIFTLIAAAGMPKQDKKTLV